MRSTSYLLIILMMLVSVQAASDMRDYESIEEKIAIEGSAEVIVIIKDQAPDYIRGSLGDVRANALHRETIVASLGDEFELKTYHEIIDGFSGTLSRAGLRKLRRSGVDYEIFEDAKSSIHPIKFEQAGINLGTSVKAIDANYTRLVLNLTGRNITVAVIDTGIDYTHPDLGGCFGPGCRVIDGYDYYNDDEDPIDDHGHGTHVAGIIGANGTYVGVAPEVQFFALKVCSSSGTGCSDANIISAIQWAVDNNSDVISMSLGATKASNPIGLAAKDVLSIAAQAAVDAGIPVIISAGNDGPGASTISVPGLAEGVITVGNSNDKGTVSITDDSISGDSSRGPGGYGRLDPDVSAPGTSITSLWKSGGTATISGTSMAAPHVSGTVALMLQDDENLTPSEIRAILIGSSRNISGNVFAKGAGIISSRYAIENDLYINVQGQDMYGRNTINDRWEFVIDPFGTDRLNVTIINNNPGAMVFTFAVDAFENMESSETLNISQLGLPDNITVPGNANITFPINFTLADIDGTSPATYGSLVHLQGNASKDISLPIIVTVPILNTHRGDHIFDNTGNRLGDVYVYAYYNNRSGNDRIKINWSTTSTDLDLYSYNWTGSIIKYNGTGGTKEESFIDSDSLLIKWIRIHAYTLATTPIAFFLNITDLDNRAPVVLNITKTTGSSALSFYDNQNATIVVRYQDLDNETVDLAVNDSRLSLLESSPGVNATYFWELNTSLLGNHTFRLNLTDTYKASAFQEFTIIVLNSSLNILSYQPTDLSPTLRKNRTLTFNQSSMSSSGILLFYWFINGTLNSTDGNFTFNSTIHEPSDYNITFIVSNNESNLSLSWLLSLLPQNNPVSFNASNNISGLSWAQGANSSNAFDLAEHFIDADNESLSYVLHNTTDITLSINGTNVSFLADGSYYGIAWVTISANDTESNATSNRFYLNVTQVVVDPPVEEEEEEPVSTGGGGGGGGGGISLSPGDSFSTFIQIASGGVEINSDNPLISVESLDIAFEGSQENIDITITQLKETSYPASVSTFSGRTHHVIEIDQTGINEDVIDRITIAFKVNNTWLKDNGIPTGEVVLYHLGAVWEPLPTRFVSSDAEFQRYEAVSDSLSTFLIGTTFESPTAENLTETNQKIIEEPEAAIHEEQPLGGGESIRQENDVPNTYPSLEDPGQPRFSYGLSITVIAIFFLSLIFIVESEIHHRKKLKREGKGRKKR